MCPVTDYVEVILIHATMSTKGNGLQLFWRRFEVQGAGAHYRGRWIGTETITDCKSLYDTVHTNNTNVAEKRLLVDIACIRSMLDNHEIDHIKWTNSETQLADALTKRGASQQKLLDVLKTSLI